jgi:CRP/FNR family transcriptional regulator/CRP/FNR family cyclic AMP-dependent transcriptional regulator
VVFHQGDPGEALHLVQSGRVKVVLDAETGEEAVIAIVGPGDCFGELSLLDGGPRTATVTATSDMSLLVLSEWVFRGLLHQHPSIAMKTLSTLAGRLRLASSSPTM